MKRLLVVYANPVCSFNSDWLSGVFNQYLDFQPWDPQRTYDPGTAFYLNCLDFPVYNNTLPMMPEELANMGFRVIVDNLWEVNPGEVSYAHRIYTPAWFWYNESRWYQHLGYDQYVPNKNVKHIALMPMRLRRPHRSDFVRNLGPLLDQMMWSYVDKGRQLPDDGDMNDWNTQRFFNPRWYDECYASMVVETLVRPGSKYTRSFITEKTMKPLAFQHPFLVYGNRCTMRSLQEWGFCTFDNLWDETYDEIIDENLRRDAVIESLRTIKIQDYDAETVRRIKHNRDHFYNRELVIDRIIKEIVEPILHYAETR